MPNLREHTCFLIEAEHEVHVLNGDAAGTFDEVIESGEHDQLAAIHANADVTEVCVRDILGVWDVINNTHKGLPGVE